MEKLLIACKNALEVMRLPSASISKQLEFDHWQLGKMLLDLIELLEPYPALLF